MSSPPIGQLPERLDIINITNALPCEITTALPLPIAYKTGSQVRLTNLNGVMPIPHGEDQLNNYKFEIVITDTNKFTLRDIITHKPIDSTLFTPYVVGGSCNLVQPTFIFYPSPDQTYPN